MDDRLQALFDDLSRANQLAGPELVRAQRRVGWVAEFNASQLVKFLTELGAMELPLEESADRLLGTWLGGVIQARRKLALDSKFDRESTMIVPTGLIEQLYRKMGPESLSRHHLLACLATGGTRIELSAWTRLITADPPREDHEVVRSLAPLFQHREICIPELFPTLLGALAHPQLAAPVLDLANFLTRERHATGHPAASRVRELIALLGELVQSLARLEECPPGDAVSPIELSKQVASQVALAVSLCDALALIGDREATGKLHQALALRHRRLRTEAAAALARLGEEEGIVELVKLAEEPVARLRVLSYASDLGIADKIDQEWQSPLARAEAQLAVHLAEPTQFGIPPARLELFDERRQFWPGFNEPALCFLFRYTYAVTISEHGERSLSNIGMAGPLVHTFLADLADLSPDDIYAAYAGWQAEHEEIREFDVARLSKSERLEAERLARRLHDAGYTLIEPQFMGYFFGDKALVASAEHEGVPGVAVADFSQIAFFPRRHSRRPLGPPEAYCIYKGRKLLRSFNK